MNCVIGLEYNVRSRVAAAVCSYILCFLSPLIDGLYVVLPFKRRVKSRLPSTGIIRSSPYSPR